MTLGKSLVAGFVCLSVLCSQVLVGQNSYADTETRVTKLEISKDDEALFKDLESWLTMTEGDLATKMREENMTLLKAALQFSAQEAILNFAMAFVVTYLATKDVVKLAGIYVLNAVRLAEAVRVGSAIADVEIIESSTAVTVSTFGAKASVTTRSV